MEVNQDPLHPFVPLGRTGHSCDVVGHYMVIFGGFYKVANELNDMHIFDLERQTWRMLHEEPSAANTYMPSREMSTYRGAVSHPTLPAYD